MSINLLAVAVLATAFVMRAKTPDHSGSILFTLLGVALISVSGWLGEEGIRLVVPGFLNFNKIVPPNMNVFIKTM